MCSFRAFYHLFYFILFFAENVGSLKTQISPKNTKIQYLAEKRKRKKKHSFGRGTLNTCAKFQGLNSQTASEGIWGFMLEPACKRAGSSDRRNTLASKLCTMFFFRSWEPKFGMVAVHDNVKKRKLRAGPVSFFFFVLKA